MTAAVVWSSWAYNRFKLPERVLDHRPDCFELSSCMLPWPAWQAGHSAVLSWYLHNLAILCLPIALLQSQNLLYTKGRRCSYHLGMQVGQCCRGGLAVVVAIAIQLARFAADNLGQQSRMQCARTMEAMGVETVLDHERWNKVPAGA